MGVIKAKEKAWEAGVLFARDVGIQDVEFEGDSLVVCNALQGLASLPSSVANVLTGFLNQAWLFRQWKVTHIKRLGNVPAHLLAQHARNVEDYVAWLEECPSLIEHACMQDRNVTPYLFSIKFSISHQKREKETYNRVYPKGPNFWINLFLTLL